MSWAEIHGEPDPLAVCWVSLGKDVYNRVEKIRESRRDEPGASQLRDYVPAIWKNYTRFLEKLGSVHR